METKKVNSGSSRRQFLTKQLPAGAFMCMGCKSLLSSSASFMNPQEVARGAKYLTNSGMTTEDVLRFTLNKCVPVYKKLGGIIGNEKFIEMLKEASAEKGADSMKSLARGKPGEMKAFTDHMKKMLSTPPYDKAIPYEITEESDKVFEIKYTGCLIAKLYREMDAAEIGFAIDCSPWDRMIKAFNSKMAEKNIKNPLKGDDVCIQRFTLET
jgi:hypothetical protein